ncbi:TetR/AcrR family transcriptional regulator C-terminal domain-containing protein [Amycolatopsis cynarae]|uniref:TetR/AcrR family transcriptional regulator C-terminal domain-containing protein n=1 Tax=Amycolatopsis cynarae TaxID=2995223 RepID=A0ABY7B2R1_9PSEU|nr:TetR/AcrR family transcriptional regulator C-terminal domain-containing protein [Amycolatopsis sp. HUAS 11-8]WAL66245.1 TetR/AcrR family transcriptional regulator C-terminal domain-containing protein [Amycolatopsis sp. HUAS 11-8]
MARETLSRTKVLDSALRLADEQGLSGVSMRKLAAELGVEAMSLYNHVANKRDLLNGVAARVFESIPLPDESLPWDQRLEAAAKAAFGVFNRHPAVVRALVSEQANPLSRGALRLIDAILGALLEAGLTERHAARAYRALLGMLYGAVLVGSADLPGGGAEASVEWFRETVTERELPHLHRTLPELSKGDCVQDFEFQLALFLGGLRAGGRCG